MKFQGIIIRCIIKIIIINNNDSIKSNHYRKIIKMNSCKINYERNNYSNILSA